MTDQQQSIVSQNCIAEQISAAFRVLKNPFGEVLDLFPKQEMCVIGETIEVRLESATLTCLFDEDNACDAAFLFLDDRCDLMQYLDFCTKEYTYNYLKRAWINENYCIKIKNDGDEPFFAIFSF